MGSHTLYVISRILESSAVECGFTSLPSRAVACAYGAVPLSVGVSVRLYLPLPLRTGNAHLA